MKNLFSGFSRVLLAVSLVSLFNLSPASAANSDKQEATVKGYTYVYYSQSSDSTSPPYYAYTTIASKYSDEKIPAGYMGAQARVYDSNDTLRASGQTEYSTSEQLVFTVSTGTSTKGSYYSYGLVKMYTGNGYTTKYAYKSPIITIKSLNSTPTYKVNKNGETYGSGNLAATIGYEPDLILAKNDEGIEGYVRAKELFPDYNSPEEALAAENNNLSSINLYDKDGETILGSFQIQASVEK
ncbi:hypothetical protein GCM10008014_44810 [Paenibacillus silvae]|uniref:Uncharacterized protein n=1 Tax=Paenibacillus silvae TaxID=1325358 RepID=A0ABQ1ZGX4_9BACL|nr:hypothetical protein [Paenibacillus silvae]GGH65438.1 hypothetical protein GCM10008014_44810 [Paenibacillus silvae]